MKTFLLLLFLFCTYQYNVFGQDETLYINGKTEYQLNVKISYGQYSGCGGQGIEYIDALYQNGYSKRLYDEGLAKNFETNKETTYHKDNKITSIKLTHLIKARVLYGWCTDADEKTATWSVTPCNYYQNKEGNTIKKVTIISKPYIEIKFDPNKHYELGENKRLQINLSDNIENEYFNWKYQVSGKGEQYFKTSKNNTHLLDVIAGVDFLTEEDYGKYVQIWVNTGCNNNISNKFGFWYYPSAPSIKEVKFSNPKCPGDKVKVTLIFDRKLKGDLEDYKKFKRNSTQYLGEKFNKLLLKASNGSSISLINDDWDINEALLTSSIIELPIEFKQGDTYSTQLNGDYTYKKNDGTVQNLQLYIADKKIVVPKIEPLTATATSIGNRCFGDTQGKIEVRVLGGTPPYKYIKNGEPPVAIAGNFFTIENLASGVYTFTITDKNNCPMASDNPLVVNVWGPKMPITIMNENTDLVTNVTGSGRADGKIEPIVMGGTLYNYNKNQYTVELYSSKGEISYSKRDLLSADNDIPKYKYVYENLEAGTYTFTVHDYYGCAIKKEIIITEPPLLTASISATTTIGCNQNNNDPNNHYELYSNGVLRATVEGGVPPYKYRWKKIGSQTPFLGNGTAIIRRLSKGTYQLVVTDKNDNEATAFYTLTEPPRLMLSVTKSEMTCSAPNGGQAAAIASGGTPPYTYLWNTGYSGAHITGLSAGKYFVTVSDSRGCSVQEKVVLSYPEEVEVNNAIITPVTCYEGNDGKIALTLSGGKGNINVSWYDAQGNLLSQRITNGGKTINGLKAGKYKAVFRDQSDCPALEQFYEVLQPEKTVINIPSQITICQGDSRSFDLSTAFPSATFRWTDSTGTLLSTEPTFAVSTKGIYKVEITDQKGCREATTFEVLQSDKVLEVDFLAATNAYYNYTVKLINLSHSITTQWVLPQEVTLIKEENGGAEVRFPKEGTYTIGLKGFLDGCEKTIYKTLWVEKDRLGIGKENSSKEVVIDDFKIVDNPNNGTFRIEVKLKKPAAIKIYGMDILGQMVISPIEQPESTTFNIPVSNSRLSGQYLIILEAGGDVMVQKMIVNH